MRKFKFTPKVNVKRLLIIYSAIILAIGIMTGTAVFNKGNNAVKADGWVVKQSYYSCAGGVTCSCPSWVPTCEVWVHNCPSGLTSEGKCFQNSSKAATLSGGQSISVSSILGGLSCTSVQIDVNAVGQASWSGTYGAAVLVWEGSCVTPPVTPPPVTPPPEEDKCPYNSTQARVKAVATDTWTRSMEIDCGSSFIVGSFHNGNLSSFASNTEIRIFNPGSGSADATRKNGRTYQTSREGRYRVLAVTKNKSGGFYTESACRGEAYVTCTNNPSYRITKVATNDNGPYDIGDTINFRVEITNTGNTTLSTIAYRDYFDNRYMRFASVVGYSPAHPTGVNMTGAFTTSVNGNITTFRSSDITAQMGDLAPGQSMHLDYTFIARSASNSACNDVFAQPGGLPEKQARDCVGIILRTDL